MKDFRENIVIFSEKIFSEIRSVRPTDLVVPSFWWTKFHAKNLLAFKRYEAFHKNLKKCNETDIYFKASADLALA